MGWNTIQDYINDPKGFGATHQRFKSQQCGDELGLQNQIERYANRLDEAQHTIARLLDGLGHIKKWATQGQDGLSARQVADAVMRMCDDIVVKDAVNER